MTTRKRDKRGRLMSDAAAAVVDEAWDEGWSRGYDSGLEAARASLLSRLQFDRGAARRREAALLRLTVLIALASCWLGAALVWAL